MARRLLSRQFHGWATSIASPCSQTLLLSRSRLHIFQEAGCPLRTALGAKIPIYSLSLRTQSTQHTKVKQYTFDDMKNLLEVPETEKVLIDVREPSEYEKGYIPSAFNLPITSMPDALFLDPQEFQDKLGFSKPSLANEVIFYCLAGIRSSIAAGKALQSGYTRIGEYKGSYLDWEEQGGATSKNPSGKNTR